jgi:hypothetical protein
MILEEILAIESVLTAFLSLTLIVLTLWKRKIITTEESWDRLMEKSFHLKNALMLMFFSLVIYLVAESAELLNSASQSYGFELIHEIGEPIHMLIAIMAIFSVTPLFKSMLGSENAS